MPLEIIKQVTSGMFPFPAHPRIEPKSFLQEDVIETYSEDYLFIGCIKFINKVVKLI